MGPHWASEAALAASCPHNNGRGSTDMKLHPQQAPLYLTEEEVAADDGDVDYFLSFVGSTQRHLTSTLRSSHDTLEALCPGKPPHSFSCHQSL
ncbi:unnamed protein product [Tetraodon nigroviridis]|uniref:(spotted green pufferfish) hypothetical protein n=1 Tax=Tetraodon nigroviridis TaxID=99883 RepID=Q4S8C5_TETNG|nr:unnamed protein product [Tetraodon nigroviridis]